MVEKTTVEGDYTTAEVMLPEEEIEEECYEQIQNIVDHEAFTESVRIMPDAHWGAGCVIGFSMPITDKIIPNVIGLDIGCGVRAIKIPDAEIQDHEEFDKQVRDTIPTGFEVRDFENSINIKEDFFWEELNERLANFRNELGENIEFDGYDIEYFKDLCDRVDYDTTRAIKSIGSVGGGNHYIEVSSDKNNELWISVHTGSRGLGKAIAEYWQDKAIENRKDDKIEQSSDTFKEHVGDTLGEEYIKYVNNDLSFNKEDIRSDYEGEEIEKVFGHLGNAKSEFEQKIEGDLNYMEELAYLEGGERHGYFIDMLFAQEYASRSRMEILEDVSDIIGGEVREDIESVHNYIDFHDLTVRKGACPAYAGKKMIIPFNMRDGAIIARGKGNDEWNQTAPHGAGRIMGRREAYEKLDEEKFKSEMSDVGGKFTGDMLDEAPMAYKETELIREQIKPTAEVVNELDVIHNIKAE